MRKLILKMSMSLDAFVAGANGELDWIFKTTDAKSTAWTVDHISNAGLHIMGSKTFHDMAAFWPTSTEVFAAPMNEVPKGVFTKKGFSGADPTRVTRAVADALKNRAAKGEIASSAPAGADSWAHPRVFDGDLATGIRQLKKEDGAEIIAHGGAGFAQSLVATGLIDEFRLLVHPVAIGKGLSLFGQLTQRLNLQLAEITPFPAGTVAHIYRPAP
ncbi:MAG TPA: dihydrofolate reductase family protein [Puia sp.]|jgi:dihydrofolate reductase|nr:dihydrofolate reductase family protein [Puia sp.]